MLTQIQDLLQSMMAKKSPTSQGFGNGYLNTGGLNPNEGIGSWEDYIRQLGFSNLENITDFNSPLYQEYAKYLQKTSPQMGVNSLLAPLMAGGMSYAGGQNIVAEKQKEFAGQRQDKINTGVQQFAGGLQSQVMPQLGQIGGSFQNTMNRVSQEDMFNAQNSGLGLVGNVLGQGMGMLNLFNWGGSSNPSMNMRSDPSKQYGAVAGYGG